LALHFRYGRFSALLTGDLEHAGETALVARAPELDAVLVKAAHHGSRSATLDAFLDRARPRWVVFSAGRTNPFGHPARETLLRVLRHGARPLLTLDLGTVTVWSDGARYRVESFVCGLLDEGALD